MSCGLLTGGRFNLPFISLPLIKPGPCMASPIHMQNVTFACSQLDLLRPDWSKPLGPGTHICLQITSASGSSGVTLVPQQRLDLASNLKQWSVRIIELICIHWLSLYLHSSVSDAPKTLNLPSQSCCHCLDLIWLGCTYVFIWFLTIWDVQPGHSHLRIVFSVSSNAMSGSWKMHSECSQSHDMLKTCTRSIAGLNNPSLFHSLPWF